MAAGVDADEHERQDGVTEADGIREGDDAKDAVVPHPAGARPHGALRDADLASDLAEGPAAVLLQLTEDRPVDRVEGLLGPHRGGDATTGLPGAGDHRGDPRRRCGAIAMNKLVLTSTMRSSTVRSR